MACKWLPTWLSQPYMTLQVQWPQSDSLSSTFSGPISCDQEGKVMWYDGHMTCTESLRSCGGRKEMTSGENDWYICSPPPQCPFSDTPAKGQAPGYESRLPCPHLSSGLLPPLFYAHSLKKPHSLPMRESAEKQTLTHSLIPCRGITGDPGVLIQQEQTHKSRAASQCLMRQCGIVGGSTESRQAWVQIPAPFRTPASHSDPLIHPAVCIVVIIPTLISQISWGITEIMHMGDLIGLQDVETILLATEVIIIRPFKWSPDKDSWVHLWKIQEVKGWREIYLTAVDYIIILSGVTHNI